MNPYIVGLLFIALLRIWGLHRLWSVAKFHGEQWCFDAPVAPGFYSTGPGSAILRGYRARMFAAFTVEVASCLICFAVGGIGAAFWAMFTATLASGYYTIVTTRRFAKEAWKYALPDAAAAAPKRVIDLSSRASGEYNNPALIWTLRVGTTGSLALLAFDLMRSGESVDWLVQVMIPAVALYAQAGLLIIRRSLAEWRVCGIPVSCAEQALEFRHQARAYNILAFEILRSWIVVFLVVWAGRLTYPDFPVFRGSYRQYWVWPLVLLTLFVMVRRKRRLVAIAHSLRGASRPAYVELPPENFHLRGLIYYDREQPAMFVRRRNFLAMNLAHPRSQLALAYLAGWVVVVGVACKYA